jgi:hypothetical protein
MQNLPISALAGVVTARAPGLESTSVPDISSPSAVNNVSFESLLAQQTQSQAGLQAKDLGSLLGQRDMAKGQVGKDDALAQNDPAALVTDLAGLLAALIQGQSSPQAVASSEFGADVAKLDRGIPEVIPDVLPLMQADISVARGVVVGTKLDAQSLAVDEVPVAKGADAGTIPGTLLLPPGAMLAAVGKGAGSKPGAVPLITQEVPAENGAAKRDALSLLSGAVPGTKPDVLPVITEGWGVAGGNGTQGVRASTGKEAAEIAGTGKDLPLAAFKLNENPVKAGELVTASNTIQSDVAAHSAHAEFFPQITGVHDSNANAPATVVVEPRLGAPGWDNALGQKVVWLVNQRHQTAEMQLNPPNLGPLEVKITISNDQASALFVSHHAAVRDAIEAAMPRLREMLAENGITLGNVQVGAESFQREQAQTGNREGRAEPGRQPEVLTASSEVMVERTGVMRLRTPGAVDVFA